MIKLRLFRSIVQYAGIIMGSALFAMGYSWFLVPYKLVPGGVGGLGQIFYHLMGIPMGISMMAINIPLFIISVIMLGKHFGIRSFYGMMVSSALTDLLALNNLYKFGIVKDIAKYTFTVDGEQVIAMLGPNDIYLSAIAGSVLLGVGLGIIFRFRGSTGGTDIPVAILKQKTGISIGTGYWMVETLIILTVGLVFQDLKLIIWGYVNLFISTKITDIASEGMPYVKGVYVISDYEESIKDAIYERLNRGVTFIKARGGYTEKDKEILFCCMNRRQVPMIRDIVQDIDPKAFMIVTDVHDVMGYGFKTRNLDLQQTE